MGQGLKCLKPLDKLIWFPYTTSVTNVLTINKNINNRCAKEDKHESSRDM